MSQYDVEKHPDFYKPDEDKTWRYILIGLAVLFMLWILSVASRHL